MPEQFVIFQKFNDEEIAKDIIEKLEQFNIPYQIEDTENFFDPTFAKNPLNRIIGIKLRPQDFEAAQKELNSYYSQQLDTIHKDYYLFSFTEDELVEILLKPDEWGVLDVQLAQKLLKEKGHPITAVQVEHLKNQRNNDLAKPETSGNTLVYLGYAFAVSAFFFGHIIGLGGFLFGWVLVSLEKVLPDGSVVFTYSEKARKNGKIILMLTAIMYLAWYIVKYSGPDYFLQNNSTSRPVYP